MEYRSRSFGVHLTGIAIIVGIILGLGVLLSVLIHNTMTGTRFPTVLPQFGTIGETIMLYGTLVWFATYTLAPLLIFAIGYRYGIREMSESAER